MRRFIKDSIEDSIRLKQEIYQSQEFLDEILHVGEETISTLKKGGKVLLCGNGGSASDAQHLAAEFVSRFRIDREPLPAIALNCNASILTSIGNDYAYKRIFERQVQALGRPGDILWCFTTTGNSKNILLAMKAAKAVGIKTVGFLGGNGGECLEYCDFSFLVPGADTPRIQESHIMIGHILCDCIEKAMFGEKNRGGMERL